MDEFFKVIVTFLSLAMTCLHSGYSSHIELSAEDMLEISQEISREFAPCFSSPVPGPVEKIRLSPRELLDIGEEISRDFAPKASYENNTLTLLPVDPGHLYAYWHLDENREIIVPENEGATPLTLRIYAQPDEEPEAASPASWFDVAVDSAATPQEVPLPETADGAVYSAAIGSYDEDDGFIALAYSNIIHVPGGRAAGRQDHDNGATFPSKNASGQGINRQM